MQEDLRAPQLGCAGHAQLGGELVVGTRALHGAGEPITRIQRGPLPGAAGGQARLINKGLLDPVALVEFLARSSLYANPQRGHDLVDGVGVDAASVTRKNPRDSVTVLFRP